MEEEKKNEQLSDNELEDVSGGLRPHAVPAQPTGYCPKCEQTFTGTLYCPNCYGKLSKIRL